MQKKNKETNMTDFLFYYSMSHDFMSSSIHIKGYFSFSAVIPVPMCVCVFVCGIWVLWQVGAVVTDPFPPPLVLSGDQREESAASLLHFPPPIHASPPGALTASAARRGPLVKPRCHSPWHLPPYLLSKCQKQRGWMLDFYLFMWGFFSSPPLHTPLALE